MENKIHDAKGLLCPKPLILLKKALTQMSESESATILIDNETAKENVERYLKDNGFQYKTVSKDEVHSISFTGASGELRVEQIVETASDSVKTVPAGAGTVFCFKSKQMGIGPDELGDILIQGCINTIPSLDVLPRSVIFYNSSAILAAKDSPVLDSLKELEKKGVKILVCGTCADYFDIKAELGVGIISNMYEILDELNRATRVIYP